jgi:uncharacterized Ntn-hydrolase superfamily protein
MPARRFVFAFLLGLAFLVAPAGATWSILIIDLATGEIAIGVATCLTNFDLRPNCVVVVPGFGVAAAQSFIGPQSLRELIRTGLLAGSPAGVILQQLALADPSGYQSRQYGIAGLLSGTITFTGSGAGAWAGDLVGQTGTLLYTIQGNVLTGQPVIAAAEQAILNTPGSIGDKLMAAMLAARSMGGDGRCSCSATAPTSCGSPPPSFTKAAHCGLMIVSRPSDLDVPCNGTGGCGAGTYWMDLNVANQPATAPDPIFTLQTMYNAWKANQVGRPDHYQSSLTLTNNSLRANAIDTITGTVALRDAQGNPLGNSLPVTVNLRSNSTATGVTFSPATPQANGSYTFTMQANLGAGDAILDVAVTDAFGRVGIWPQPHVQVLDLFGVCGRGAIGNGAGGVIDALRIDNSGGGTNRVVDVGFGQPFTLSLQPPVGAPALPPVGMFALWAHIGRPAVGTEVPLGTGNGALCFTPAPFSAAPTLLFADSFGLGGWIYAPAAPWSVPVPGVPALLDITLQGVMVTDPFGTFAATNALLLRTQPLPAPTITAVVPPSPTPAQLVTVQGTNFLGGVELTINGVVQPFTSLAPTLAQFMMPAGVSCDSVLRMTNLGGPFAQRPINATPVISSMPFISGPAAGGSLFIIVGTGMLGCTVTIGGVPIVLSTQTATAVTGSTPPGAVGPQTVLVRNPNGCQTTAIWTYL